MSDIPPKPESMSSEFYETCLAVTAKRARTVILHILKHGRVTTEELKDVYGYQHPPRAVRDVRDNGIPIETVRVKSAKTGRMIAAYQFADTSEIIGGRLGGRKSFTKKFKQELIAYYGARSILSNELVDARYLQIDHRIPYAIIGNAAGTSVEHFMLLDASAQRAKSWTCENCENFRTHRNPDICRSCFWAYPESYTHVAMRPERRLDITWSSDEAQVWDAFVDAARKNGMTPQQLVKHLIAKFLDTRKETYFTSDIEEDDGT